MSVTLVMTADLWDQLVGALADDHEVAGILAVRPVNTADGLVLIGRRLTWAPPGAYLERGADGLMLTSPGWVPAARAAVADTCIPVFVHTHPGGKPIFSDRDDDVDAALRAALPGLGSPGPYAALVVAGSVDDPLIAGRVDGTLEPVPITKIRVVGDRLQVHQPTSGAGRHAPAFDRQIRMFGADGQHVLAGLHVAVVGVGGTGSACAEQLARLGIGTLTLIDDDVVTEPTPTRGYGTTVKDIGEPKARVVANWLRQIGLTRDVRPLVASVWDAAAIDALKSADLVFSCVDGHGARLLLNRWAYAYLTPVLDVAVLVSAEAGLVTGVDGRVTWLSFGAACLLCRGRLDPAAAYAEVLAPEERYRLAGEGYAHEADTPQPAVVTLTSLVASLATTELLFRAFAITDTEPTEVLALLGQRELRRNRITPRDGCFCADTNFLGRGDQPPHLDLLWPA